MAATPKKTIKLRAFRVVLQGANEYSSHLFRALFDVLSNSVVDQRRMSLNEQDEDEDILSNFEFVNGYLFGTMIRIIPSEKGDFITPELFKHEKMSLSDLDNQSKQGHQYKGHYYFALNDRFLVTNLSGSCTIERLQTYINWLLQEVRGEKQYSFATLINQPNDLTLADIRSIEFGGGTVQPPENEGEKNEGITQRVVAVAKDLLEPIFKNKDNSSNEVDYTQIISAKLLLTIAKKPKEMSQEVYQRIMSSFVTPITNDNALKIHTKKSGTLSGNDLKVVNSVNVELTDSGRIIEEQLKQKMESFLLEIKSKFNEISGA